MSAGNAECTTGLSLRLYTALSSAPGMVSPLNEQAISALKGMSYAIAVAVVAEIKTNAQAVFSSELGNSYGTVT